MGRNKWSVTRFKTNAGGGSWGPRAKYRFETWLPAKIVFTMCQIEALFTGHTPWLSYIPAYSIDTEIGIDFADEGVWRSFHLETSGDSMLELLENATVSEVDQDGGTLDAYSLEDASAQVSGACFKMISDKMG